MIEIEVRDLEPPSELVRRMTEIGGLNPFNEPNFRVIWGWKRLAWHGGKFYDRDDRDNVIRVKVDTRLEPKYFPPNRWYFEVWLPPEAFGSENEWYEQTVEWIDGIRVETLGPYPKRGDYEMFYVLQTKEGEFAPLTPTVAEMALQMVIFSRNLPTRLRVLARKEKQEQAAKQREAALLDKIADRAPVFGGEVFVTIPKRISPNGEERKS